MQLDLSEYIAKGFLQLEAFLLKHALFADFCDRRDKA